MRMVSSLTGLVRLVGLLTLAACGVAIGLARLEPRPARYRMAASPLFGVINGFTVSEAPGEPRLLDPETGRLSVLKMPKGDRLDYGTCSPWLDEEGEFQVVGRWSGMRDEDPKMVNQFGLARCALPGGQVIDRVPLDVNPSGPVCWFPGMVARVLYTGTDGRLYTLAFEKPGTFRARDDDGDKPEARPVSWNCGRPGTKLSLRDPVWPSDPRLKGRLVVSLSYRARGNDEVLRPSRLWWLQLDKDGTAVVDAGPMRADAEDPGSPDEERFPNLASGPGGKLYLAYHRQRTRRDAWELRLAPVELGLKDGIPTYREEDSRKLSDSYAASVMPFSPDGAYLYGVVRGKPLSSPPQVVRFPTELPGETAAASGLRPSPNG